MKVMAIPYNSTVCPVHSSTTHAFFVAAMDSCFALVWAYQHLQGTSHTAELYSLTIDYPKQPALPVLGVQIVAAASLHYLKAWNRIQDSSVQSGSKSDARTRWGYSPKITRV